VKDENGDLLADYHNVLNRSYFSHLLKVHSISDDKQIEMHTVQSLVLGPSLFVVESAAAKLERYKSAGTGQIPEELISRRWNITVCYP
jgi:hypothetical protein